MDKTIIVNIFGGPGAGKSTAAAGVFYELKRKFVNCELVTEYAKDKVWQESTSILNNQIYVFGKQHNRIFHLKDKVDVIVTDSPFIMGLVYADYDKVSPSFEKLVSDEFQKDDVINLNFVISRVRRYQQEGRLQDEKGAKALDKDIIQLLGKHNIEYTVLKGKESTVPIIVEQVIEILENNS
jgi:nicotinamide riboside kinase